MAGETVSVTVTPSPNCYVSEMYYIEENSNEKNYFYLSFLNRFVILNKAHGRFLKNPSNDKFFLVL